MNNIKRFRTLRDYTDGMILSCVAFFLLSISIIALSNCILRYINIYDVDIKFFVLATIQYGFHLIDISLPGKIFAWPWLAIAEARPDFAHVLTIVFWIANTIAFFTSIFVFVKSSSGMPEELHITGRQLSTDPQAAQAEIKNEPGKPGVFVHPKVQFTTDRETKHILILGGVGAGKTQILWPIVHQIRKNQDKAIIHDVKGDFSSSFDDDDFLRFAPWDDRGVYWDISADIQTKNDCREVAACFVKEGQGNPMWHQAARMVFVTFLEKLRLTRPGAWGWEDLRNVMTCDIKQLQKDIKAYNEEASRLVKDGDSKTTDSIMITVDAFMSTIHDLAEIWGNGQGMRKLSIKQFLHDDYTGTKTLILQNNQAYANVLQCIYPAMLRLMAGYMNGPFFADSKTRKIWFILDEFPQLGKLENFGPILETGRSKGLRGIIGCQDTKQLERLYSREEMESWTSLMGTWIIGKIAGSATSGMVSDAIGKRKFKLLQKSGSVEQNLAEAGNSAVNLNYSIETDYVIPASDLSRVLKVDKTGITALLILWGTDNGLYKLKWNFTNVKEQRAVAVNKKLGFTEKTPAPDPGPGVPQGAKKTDDVQESDIDIDSVDLEKLLKKMQARYQALRKERQKAKQNPGPNEDKKRPNENKTEKIKPDLAGEIAEEQALNIAADKTSGIVSDALEYADPALNAVKCVAVAATATKTAKVENQKFDINDFLPPDAQAENEKNELEI